MTPDELFELAAQDAKDYRDRVVSHVRGINGLLLCGAEPHLALITVSSDPTCPNCRHLLEQQEDDSILRLRR